MKPTELDTDRLDDLRRDLRAKAAPHAVATVVRSFAPTSAKAGAKALVNADGEIIEGWVGGGCARGAVGRAAKTAIRRNDPVLVALRPDDRLAAEGVEPCELRDGMVYERNGCASKGSMDIYVEPYVPCPDLVILGDGPVAKALTALARPFDFRTGTTLPETGPPPDYVVVATQGRGDARSLRAALDLDPGYLAFVGSARKAAALREALARDNADAAALARLVAPAGLPIGAATPEEIALAILAQIVAHRRGAPAP